MFYLLLSVCIICIYLYVQEKRLRESMTEIQTKTLLKIQTSKGINKTKTNQDDSKDTSEQDKIS